MHAFYQVCLLYMHGGMVYLLYAISKYAYWWYGTSMRLLYSVVYGTLMHTCYMMVCLYNISI